MIDKMLRSDGKVAKSMRGTQYLHASLKPIDEIDFGKDQNSEREMAGECEGMCGH